jgi:endonuclease/exonuclease/phosphatase family metal-dependent hydrolase
LKLKPDPVENEGRNALFTKLSGLTICNTHLDVWDRTGKTRLQQVKQIEETLHKLNKHHVLPALVCGDFNTQRQQDYTPAQWSALKTKYVVETLALDYIQSKGAEDVLDSVQKKSSTSIPGLTRRIDFMFVFDPHVQLNVYKAAIDKKADFSDHFPVIATLVVFPANTVRILH